MATRLGAWRRLRQWMHAPQQALQERFRTLKRVLGPSAHGRALGLDRCPSLQAFRELPVTSWEDTAPWVQRVAAGEPGVMSTEPIELVEPTGGSSGGTKWIPYTARLRREFDLAVGAWMVDLHRHRPALFGTRHYWSVSRAVKRLQHTEGGLPIGLQSDSAYFDPVTRWLLAAMMVVPDHVAHAPSLEAWRERTLLRLLEADDLGLISVWSPTFLQRLLHQADDVPLSPAAAARRARFRDTGQLMDLWPRLSVLSAWADGFAARPFAALAGTFPGAQPKGLLATEGVVSIPLWGKEGSVVCLTHLVELRTASGEAFWPHEVALGARYQPMLTTGGGLIRYALPDEVEVVGFTGRLPRIRLVGRLDKGSDLVGEKLTPAFVRSTLADHPGFAMLVPRTDHYVLVSDRPWSAEVLDAGLCRAHHYAYARELDQLRPARVVVLQDAWSRWEQAVEAAHLVLGDQKPSALETRPAIANALLDGAPKP